MLAIHPATFALIYTMIYHVSPGDIYDIKHRYRYRSAPIDVPTERVELLLTAKKDAAESIQNAKISRGRISSTMKSDANTRKFCKKKTRSFKKN